MTVRNPIALLVLLLFTAHCRQPASSPPPRFTLLDAANTGIDFRNDLPYTDTLNCYLFRNFYNGGGVGIGDLNNDGLSDVLFCGNLTSNRLYLNRGSFNFDDVTQPAGLASDGAWTTGVALADVNGDGWLDIYVCKSGPPSLPPPPSQGGADASPVPLEGAGRRPRHNELFINNGDAAAHNGVPTFTEQSRAYGLDFTGLSTHAAFFDYDRDGDLDCYLLNNSLRSVGAYDFRPGQREKPDPEGGNRLLRNRSGDFSRRNSSGDFSRRNSSGDFSRRTHEEPATKVAATGSATKVAATVFEDVTQAAGIYASAIGFGLGVTVGDYDRDGWPDLFISNDFFERDYLYHNQGDGTFRELLPEAMAEISKGSMGADMADLTNDGFPEIFVTEMTPPGDARYKTKTAFDNWTTYQTGVQTGYHRQFGRNALHLNRGDGTFAECSRLTGTWASDWSWGALLADFDNDGYKDVFVANGIGKDLLDQDYLNFYSDPAAIATVLRNNPGNGIKTMIDAMPSEPVPNCLFRNPGFRPWQGDSPAVFADVAADWGLATPSFSNGSAYGDLDNDGDLDLLVNNVNMPPFVYRNETNNAANWLTISLQGEGANTAALGAQVTLQAGGEVFYQELAPMRGFESCVEPRLHFGLGRHAIVDTLTVIFPSGKTLRQTSVAVNQALLLAEANAASASPSRPASVAGSLFAPVTNGLPAVGHLESAYSDFDREPLLFRMYSAEGPRLATADVDGDGRTDYYLGGAAGQPGRLFVQKTDGAFAPSAQPAFDADHGCEDSAAAFFDADADGDADLYVGSGSNEFDPGAPGLQDRLYLNDGRGRFRRAAEALPAGKPYATACVRPADVDGDGDLDVFVGMRLVPGHYGLPPRSFILENDGTGRFKPAVQRYPALANLGMVTDAVWFDLASDGDPDLLVVGEWEPIRVFQNTGGQLVEAPAPDSTAGWWNHVTAADLDGDGDTDFVLGNHGLNSRFRASRAQPLTLFVADFDQNGREEPIFCQYNGPLAYPIVLRNDLVRQLPGLKKKYLKFADYKNQTAEDVFGAAALATAQRETAYELRSMVLWNDGPGRWRLEPLPVAAQLSPVYAAAAADFTGDGHPDLLLAGNDERCKPETGVYLASTGVLLAGNGRGDWQFVPGARAGLRLEGVTRDLAVVPTAAGKRLLVARNDGPLGVFGF